MSHELNQSSSEPTIEFPQVSERQVMVERFQEALVEKFAIDPSDISLVRYDGRQALILSAPNPLYMGSYSGIMDQTEENREHFVIEVDGNSIDTRGLTLEHYAVMIETIRHNTVFIPDSSSVLSLNKPWMGTWLTGERSTDKFAQFACVFGEECQVYQNWLPLNNPSERYGFRPVIELPFHSETI